MQEKKGSSLSRTILEMKFMKKSKERVQKEEEDAEGQAMYSNEITEEMRKSGRLSFGGMNPEVEKFMSNEYALKLEEANKRKEKDITDVEMAKHYSTVVNTVSKKFQDKRSRNQNKRKFLKPADD